jgi:hypothetical protein
MMKAAMTGNLICDVMRKNPDQANPLKKGANLPRKAAAIATLPAVPFTISAE